MAAHIEIGDLRSQVVALRQPAAGRPQDGRRTALRAAYILSGLVAGFMVAASAVGLLLDGLYRDGGWARAAFRGGDLATLVVAVPLLVVSLVLSMRGSRRAQPIWLAMLGYSVYNYAYYAFGAAFNDAFLLHIALLSMSIFALACAASGLSVAAFAASFRAVRGTRWVGGLLMLIGIAQGGLWIFLLLRFALTGQLLNDIPVEGQHLVFALDLTLLVPSLVVGGMLLYRRTAMGLVIGTAVSVFGVVYQINLMLAGVFAESAGVAGATAFPLEGVLLTGALAVASAVLLLQARERDS